MGNPETKQFGRYEIVGELGRGAMGVVYKARDPQIDRLVALKTVSLRGQEPEEAAEFRQRFRNEAQAAGRLHHPGIVSIFDVGEETQTGEPYIVLEYVAGESLNKILTREKKLPLAKALQLAAEVAEALDYAHTQGVVHRDIKPGNILVTEAGRAKIADFGIAKLNLARLTVPGRVLGTPAYMSPEQLAGDPTDGRSDLFSLGVILYAMVTGHSPFQGDSATTVSFKVANREPLPPSALDLTLPPELDAVISCAMAKNPGERYQSGAELADDIRRLQAQLGAQTRTGSTTTSFRAIPAIGTRNSALKPPLSGRPAVGPAYAVKMIRDAIHNARWKDLALGGLTVVLLLIIAVQSKLLVGSRTRGVDPVQISASSIRSNDAAAVVAPAAPVRAESTATSSTAKVAARKAAAKTPARKAASLPVLATEVVVPFSTVELAIRHQFKDATLTVWIDNTLALTRTLHGATQKRLVVFGGVRGVESETLKVPAGKHTLRFRTQAADGTTDLSKTISAEFIGGNERTLQITYEKHNTIMRLEWQ
jgi:serine/threonine-protein kinase